MDDTEIVSRSFLTVFFMDINNLKDALTGYRSIILRLQIKTDSAEPKEVLAGLNDEMKNALIQWSDSVRHNVERCQIGIIALSETINEVDTSNLTESYNKIINQFTPNLEDVSMYTFEINRQFIKGTLEKLLNKMEAFYEQFTKK